MRRHPWLHPVPERAALPSCQHSAYVPCTRLRGSRRRSGFIQLSFESVFLLRVETGVPTLPTLVFELFARNRPKR